MKAITIIQPWATLIAIGAKKFETRSWPTKYRGPLAIHAGKKIDREVCEHEPIKAALAAHGYTADNLPTGSIVATVNLAECHPINVDGFAFAATVNDAGAIVREYVDNELAFGHYEVGRFAWELTNVQMLSEPIPAIGRQGLWNWTGAVAQ